MAGPPKSDTTVVEVHIGRRRLLTWMVAAPTLVVAARLGLEVPPASAQASADTATFDLFLALNTDGRIALTMPRTETGQGISTGMAMLVAEELDADLSSVDVHSADADPRWLVQLTGLSTTMRYLADPVRAAAACARARLITAAAHRWHLPASSLTTARGEVRAPDGRRTDYGTLAHEAAQVVVAEVPPQPKSPSAYTLVGQPTGRLDAHALVTGAARFTLDLPHPEAVCTVVARPPTLRGTVRSHDASAALALPGVVGVVPLPNGVAVAAGNFAQALAARDALNISWRPGPAAGLSDADIRSTLKARVGPRPLPPLLTLRTLEARFDFPYLAHAPLETQDCVARVAGETAEVWLGAQDPQFTQREVATALGWALSPGRVQVHTQRSGGAFGRRFFSEPAIEAALVSRALGRTVRLMWTRNDDMRQGRYRPASHHRLLAWVDSSGGVLGYDHLAVIPTLDLSHGFGDLATSLGSGLSPEAASVAFFGLSQQVPYQLGLVNQQLLPVSLPIPTASFRSVYSGQVVVANEIFMDQVARELGVDAVQWRRSRLTSSRLLAVLDTVVREGQWGRALPTGVAQGVAVHEEWDSSVAHLVEVDTRGPTPRVTRVTVAADVGLPINPRSIEAQLQGATVDALSTTLSAGLHLDAGAVREGSFADYKWLRMRDTPVDIRVHLVRSDDRVGGVGELGYPTAAAALSNALARATGVMPTRFPILDSGA